MAGVFFVAWIIKLAQDSTREREQEELRTRALAHKREKAAAAAPQVAQLATGRLTELAVPVRLFKNEHCHFQGHYTWYEQRKRGKRERFEVIDEGTLYITDRRLLFEGNGKTKSMPYEKILRWYPAQFTDLFSDGIIIEKPNSHSPHIAIEQRSLKSP